MLRALAFLAMTCAAHADEQMTWGPSSATLGPCLDAAACVVVVNMLGPSETFVSGAVQVGDMVVRVDVRNGPGDVPDTVTVTPPIGYWVEPATATIDEGRSVVFRLFAQLLG